MECYVISVCYSFWGSCNNNNNNNNIINSFKNKINCSRIDMHGFRMPTEQITNFSTFNMTYVSRGIPSWKYLAAVNSIFQLLDF
jgi:hypothetical protein